MKVLIRDFEMQKLCLDFNGHIFFGALVGPVVVLIFVDLCWANNHDLLTFFLLGRCPAMPCAWNLP